MRRDKRRRRSRELDWCSKRRANLSRSAEQRARLDARCSRHSVLNVTAAMSLRRLAVVTCGSSRDAESLASSSIFWRWARRRRFWRGWRRSRASLVLRTTRRGGAVAVSISPRFSDDVEEAARFPAVADGSDIAGGQLLIELENGRRIWIRASWSSASMASRSRWREFVRSRAARNLRRLFAGAAAPEELSRPTPLTERESSLPA